MVAELTWDVPIQLQGGYVGYSQEGGNIVGRGCIKAIWGIDRGLSRAIRHCRSWF